MPKPEPLAAGVAEVPAASAAFSAARLAGLPDFEPFFLAGCDLEPPNFAPGIGPMPGTCGIPPLATVFIILAACSKRLTRALTSVTVVPEPLAMRRRREPLSTLGCVRSAFVIDWMMASVRVISD